MSDNNYSSHYSVMRQDCLRFMREELRAERESFLFADMTFGAGGHTFAMAESWPRSKVVSVDQDPEAYANGLAQIKERGLEGRVFLEKMNYQNFPAWWQENKNGQVLDCVVMDLGVSSHHFDSFERGFSFREDAPLDMRMACDDDSVPTAAWILNHLPEEEIANIIFEYGEERLSRKIARRIAQERSKKPLETTKELENICFHAYPPHMRHKRTHPATRTFQALRIYVNAELEVLKNTLPKLFGLLGEGGILQVISFHSLEDRIVKRTFKDIFQSDKNAARILTKRPLTPSEEELAQNPRSRSAKLRVVKKESSDPGGIDYGVKNKEKKNVKNIKKKRRKRD